MEGIELERLTLICSTLHDPRILGLRSEMEALKPKCKLEGGTLYVDSPFFKIEKSLFYHDPLCPETIQALNALLVAMKNGQPAKVFDPFGEYIYSTDGTWIDINDDVELDVSHSFSIKLPNETFIPILEQLLS